MDQDVLQTDRLVLRRWRQADLAPFAALNADPEVMRYFPAPLDLAESDALVTRAEAHFEDHGFGLWALEVTATGEFIGFTGLVWQTFPAPFNPSVEVGWRLSRPAWGHGYATEAARAAVTFVFATTDLVQIVSMTARDNWPSRRVMERLGMTYDQTDDFAHPRVPVGSPLRDHVLYRLDRPAISAS